MNISRIAAIHQMIKNRTVNAMHSSSDIGIRNV